MFMDIPTEVAVMTLRSETLFPQALLPLYIYERRHRRMLVESLHSHRMFVVAMQRRGFARESPSTVAGLGLVRVCVDNPDGTSHLILQGHEPGGIDRNDSLQTISSQPHPNVASAGAGQRGHRRPDGQGARFGFRAHSARLTGPVPTRPRRIRSKRL